MSPGAFVIPVVARTARTAVVVYSAARTLTLSAGVTAMLFFRRAVEQDAYNVLWAVVFGFATLNILSLAARRFEPTRRGLSFGELLAVMVVLMAVVLLGWEMLNLFHIFPIKLKR